jgi:hypothetical protein
MKLNIRKCLNVLVVEGTLTRFFFFKKPFNARFYYTPVKKKVLDFKSEGIELRKLGEFKIGMDLSEIESWVEKAGHQSYHIRKF